MRKPLIRIIWLGLIGVWALGGCVENDKSLVIIGVAPLSDTGELPAPDPTEWLSAGALDVCHPGFGGAPSFSVNMQINNYIIGNCNLDNNALECMGVNLHKVVVSYKWLSGRQALLSSRAPKLVDLEKSTQDIWLSARIGPASDCNSPGKTMSRISHVINQATGTELSALGTDADDLVLGLQMKAYGTTAGGMDIESNEYLFPIRLTCLGLAVRCCTEFPEASGLYPCTDPMSHYAGWEPGQDLARLPCEDGYATKYYNGSGWVLLP